MCKYVVDVLFSFSSQFVSIIFTLTSDDEN